MKSDRKHLLGLWRYVRPYRRRFAVALALLVLSFGIELLGPFLIRRVIDGPLAQGAGDATGAIVGLALAYLGCILVGTVLGTGFALLTAGIGRHVVRDLRTALWGKLVRVDSRWHDQNPSGRVVTRITTDLENLDELVSSGGLQTVFDLMKLVGIVVTLAFVQPGVFLLALLAVPLAGAVSLLFRSAARRAYNEVRTRIADQNAFTAEFIGGVRTVRAYGREDLVDGRYGSLNAATRGAWEKTIRSFAAFFAAVDFVLRLAQSAILLVGGRAVALGTASAGSLVQSWLYFGKLQEPIRELGERYNVLQSALSSAERVMTILDQPDGPGDGPHTRAVRTDRGAGALRFESVWFGYDPARPVLRGLDLAVEGGRTVAIVGPTGAGKSTLLSLVSRLHDVDAGTILLDGEPLRAIPVEELRRRVAVVPQEPLLFDGSILDNTRLFDDAMARERVVAVLDELGAASLLRRRGGIDAPVGERGQSLSRGERQLIAFARALLRDPDVLVLDEATASVDTATEQTLQRALRTLRKDRTCLVVAHRLATVRDADEIVVVTDGRIAERGRHAALLALDGLYAHMHRVAVASS
ncbi:MAG: ABC transporter ATP-binding protein [Planctomycetota bacterium]